MRQVPIWMLFSALALPAALSGCGTLFNMKEQPPTTLWPAGPSEPTLRPYGGLRYDFEALNLAVEGGHFDAFDLAVYMPWFEFVVGVDMPLCLVADTLTLPWTIQAAVERSQGIPRGYGSVIGQTFLPN
jgi:uncharacterized protein YceK